MGQFLGKLINIYSYLSTLREKIYISYKIGDQCPRIGIPDCIVLHFLCRNASKLVVIGYFGEGTKILYLSTIWPIRVQESCTSPHKTTLGFLTINMYLSKTFWSKVQKFCTHLQSNQLGYKKTVLHHINNIGFLDHKYVPIYIVLEQGTEILYPSTI